LYCQVLLVTSCRLAELTKPSSLAGYFLCWISQSASPSGRAWVCSRSLAGIVGSNPADGMDVCLLWVPVLSVESSAPGRSFVQRSFTECVREALITRRPWPTSGCCLVEKKNISLSLLHAAVILKTFQLRESLCLFERDSPIIHSSARCLESVLCDNNPQGFVAFSFATSEPVRFFLFGMFNGKQYSNNPRTEDDLKENSKSTLHCFHFHNKNFDVQRTSEFVRCEMCMLTAGKCFSSTFFECDE
jgi:hypothetical protein